MRRQAPPKKSHPEGVGRVLVLAVLCGLFALLPYHVPGLERLQVVAADGRLPFASLLEEQPPIDSLRGALQRRNPYLDDDDEALMSVAPLPEALPLEARPSRPPAATDRRDRIPLPRVDPEEYARLTQEIEDPEGALRPLFARLARVQREEPSVLARIGVYGTSTNGADRMTSQLRRLLQDRFGDGGKGFVPVAPGWQYQRHQDVEWEARGWRTFVVNRHDGPLDRYGYGGVVAVPRAGRPVSLIATAEAEPGSPGRAVRRFQLFYQAFPGGGGLRWRIDDGEEQVLQTGAERVEDRTVTFEAPSDGAHVLHLRPDGAPSEVEDTLRLYGVAMERSGPGVVVDGLPLIGAFTRVLLNWDERHLAVQLSQREPDLLVFWMGANDAVSEAVPYYEPRYRENYLEILRRFRRARPETGCLVMSILDKGQQVNGRVRTRRRVPRIVQAQRAVALEAGCAFFDTYEAMGGSGTMRRWYASRPRLVTPDLGHLTDRGSVVMGTLLYRALIKAYDDWIADGEPANDAFASAGREGEDGS
jgi:lysophospholipase L1-like esterase